MTAPRRAIADAVERLDAAFTVDDLVAEVRRSSPDAGKTATVYRAVTAMTRTGHIEPVGERGGAALYARCHTSHHHHHIVCDRCGKTATADCPVGAELTGAATGSGFVITRHEVTLYGLCPDCAKQ